MYTRKKAAALKYEAGYEAPVVSAAGVGFVADKIIEEANKNNVPVVIDKELTELLTNVNVGDSIPAELYEAVAKIIAYIMDTDKSIKHK